MTFQKIQAQPVPSRPAQKANPKDVNPLWAVLRDLRSARDCFGLKDRTLTVLQALISLAPKSGASTRIFASNITLSDRANGMGERTLRRHIRILVGLGLIERHDSTNRKRYARRDPDTGELVGYGFDLSPLKERASEIAHKAAETAREAGRIALLRDRLMSLRQALLEAGDPKEHAESLRKLLRRKLNVTQLEELIANAELGASSRPPAPSGIADDLSGNDGQNDRHIQRSNTEEFESDTCNEENTTRDASARNNQSMEHKIPVLPDVARGHAQKKEAPDISLRDIKAACPEIFLYAIEPVQRWQDMNRLGRSVATMAGITEELIEQAEQKLGKTGFAVTLAAMIQMGSKIRSHGAYLRSLVSGRNADSFDPLALVTRMARAS